MYYYFLYHCKEDIMNREKADHHFKSDDYLVHYTDLVFLYKIYEPEYWYWEIVETVRRLVFTCILAVSSSLNSNFQAMNGMMR